MKFSSPHYLGVLLLLSSILQATQWWRGYGNTSLNMYEEDSCHKLGILLSAYQLYAQGHVKAFYYEYDIYYDVISSNIILINQTAKWFCLFCTNLCIFICSIYLGILLVTSQQRRISMSVVQRFLSLFRLNWCIKVLVL